MKSICIGLRLPREQHAALKKLATTDQRTVSGLIRLLITQHLAKHGSRK